MITTEQIQSLRSEAATAGDLAMVASCDEAIAGDDAAMRNVATVLADAAAQDAS